MKRLFYAIVVLIFTTVIASSAMAAWTITANQETSIGTKMIVKITLTGDGNALSENIWPYIPFMPNKYIYRYVVNPDDTNPPSTTYTITMTDKLGDTATLTDLSTTVTKTGLISNVSSSNGFLSMYNYLLLTCEDIGNGNKTVLYLEGVD